MIEELPFCACGCGGRVSKIDNKWIVGHNGRNQSRKHSDKTREKLRVAAIKQFEDPKQRENARDAANKRYEDPLEREKSSRAAIKQWGDPEQREKNRKSQLKRYEDPSEHERSSIAQLKRWEDPKEHEKASAAAQGIPYEEWESFASEQLYCPDFNDECRESNREKYGRICFLTGLPEKENITSTGKQQKLSVHHVDMDKWQGCSGKKWKLVPLCLKWHNRIHTKLWEARIVWLLDNVW